MHRQLISGKGTLLLLIAIVLFSCNKNDDPVDVTPAPSCTVIAPADSARVQLGSVIRIKAGIQGFGDEVKLSIRINGVQLGETSSEPWEYLWDTEGWDVGAHKLTADAYEPGLMASDHITLIIIDTIPPLMPPVPVIQITPGQGTTDTVFIYDASGSYDQEDELEALLFRWDFDGDGSWETDFTSENLFMHKYTHPNNYQVKLQVMDTDSMMAVTVKPLLVSHSGNPDACEGYVTVYHAGKVYKTVAIGNQCWLRENLDVGEMIGGGEQASDNEVIEKYCFDDEPLNCEKYGGLYTWHELMNYASIPGGRGICPQGWHVPTDAEWKELEGYADTQYGIGDAIWDGLLYRGFDAAKHLKSLSGWTDGGNGDNLHDFKALPGGSWRINYGFRGKGEEARYWSSSHDSGQNAFHRLIKHERDDIYRDLNWDAAAFSVRCLRN